MSDCLFVVHCDLYRENTIKDQGVFLIEQLMIIDLLLLFGCTKHKLQTLTQPFQSIQSALLVSQKTMHFKTCS